MPPTSRSQCHLCFLSGSGSERRGSGSAADWGPRLSLLLCPGLSSSAVPGAQHLGCKETDSPPSCPPRSPGCQGDSLNSLVSSARWSVPIYFSTPTPRPSFAPPSLTAPSSALGRFAPRPQEGSTRRRPAPTGQPCPAPPGSRARGPGTARPCAHGGGQSSAPGRAEGVRGSQACGGESQDQLRV